MARKSKIYFDGHFEWAENRLDQLSQNPKGFQLKDLIAKLLPKIETAQEAGYALEDIAAALSEGDISIAPNTLKQYIQEVKILKGQSSSDSRPRSKKSGKSASSKHNDLHLDSEESKPKEVQEESVNDIPTNQDVLQQIDQIGRADGEGDFSFQSRSSRFIDVDMNKL